MRIKLSEIYIGDRQRKDYGRTEMEDLQKDLEENGQIQAITVRPPNDDDRTEEDYGGEPWVLVAGGRRLNAAALLGWQDLEGYAREEMSTLVANVLELHENLKRKPMSWQEQVDAKAQIARLRRMENPEITDREIAQELGESAANFSRDLKTAEILEKSPGLRKASSKHAALNAGKIIQEHEDREKRASHDPGRLAAAVVGNPEDRIRTEEAIVYARKLEADSIDLVLLDGPYGYNYWKAGHKATQAEGDHLSGYDDDPERTGIMYRELFPELVRVARPTGWLVMFAGKETYDFLEELAQDCCATHGAYRHAQFPTKCESADSKPNSGECRFLIPNPYPWIWYRPNSRNQPRYPHLHAKNMAELILVCNMGKGRLTRTTPSVKVHDTDYGTTRVHANQKPITLYRDLIEDFTFSGDSVLDTFFGSGNSLGAAASLGRIPYGCDKNPEMLPFALGRVRELQQLISPEAIKASKERFLKGLANPYAEAGAEELEEGAQAVASGPPSVERKAAEVWEFEIFRIGEFFVGYFKYDGHNMGQRRSTDGDALEMEMAEGCERLEQLSTLQIIDPCCCTPEEAMAALRNYEESLMEVTE